VTIDVEKQHGDERFSFKLKSQDKKGTDDELFTYDVEVSLIDFK